MARTRLEISISYTDAKGKKRFANKLGNVWIDPDTMKGSIDLPPGVSISGGTHWVNIAPPFDGERGGRGGDDGENF